MYLVVRAARVVIDSPQLLTASVSRTRQMELPATCAAYITTTGTPNVTYTVTFTLGYHHRWAGYRHGQAAARWR